MRRTVAVVPTPVQPPSPWTRRLWLFNADEEAAFVSRLARLASSSRHRRARKWARSDVTLVVTALRAGADADQVCRLVPGVNPYHLVAAYRELERRRSAAFAAWTTIVETPGTRTLLRCAGAAAALLPVPVGRLISISDRGDDAISAAVHTEHGRVEAAWTLFDDTLTHICQAEIDDLERIVAARSLFHPDGTGLIGSPTLLPRRVGEMSPLRVATLLGDDGAEDE